ncbi:MAG: hypothetical protein EOO43_23995, partial [Flavobacterium sp.]
MVSRLPYHVTYRLREMSASKQNWIENRLENLKNMPLFKNIQKRLEVQNSPNESFGEHKTNRTSNSNNSHIQEKALKTETSREKYVAPYKRNDLIINPTDPDYNLYKNVAESFSTFYKGDRPEDKTLRSYNPAFFPHTTKTKTFSPTEHPPIKPKSQRGLRLISYDNLKKTSRFGLSAST